MGPVLERNQVAGAPPQPHSAGSDCGEVPRWPRVICRPATSAELPYLAARLAEDPKFEKVDLKESIVYVTEYDGQLVGFGAARLMWQVEPLFLFPEFKKHGPGFARKRATYLLIRELDAWIFDPERNTTKIFQYFCFITDRVMQKLALSFQMLPAYVGGKFFGRRLFGREI